MHVVFTFQVAKALIELFGEMVFVHGFVHGDPHPGNILVSPQGHGNFSLGTQFALDMVFFYLSIITLQA
jgi:predicted unusual protein kinase regulating ubiquinone biosynthesis (AarF/ABC1/UbiB family)